MDQELIQESHWSQSRNMFWMGHQYFTVCNAHTPASAYFKEMRGNWKTQRKYAHREQNSTGTQAQDQIVEL